VEVLGTHFNVSAYDDDLLVKTTLVSGKVNVYSIATKEGKILNPGEQSVLTAGDPFIYVKKVNVEGATAWKDGNFMFEDLYLKDIMKQLSRWYDVEVDLKNLPETRYNIFISRNETLSNVLRMLEKTGNIKFSLINNTIKINR
jgi:ferric-dicitrate binding protein FerR (iron transport regulator)